MFQVKRVNEDNDRFEKDIAACTNLLHINSKVYASNNFLMGYDMKL